MSGFRVLLALLYAGSFALIGWFVLSGADFYGTPLSERAHHPGYWDWKAGGRIGHALGVAGSSMMVLMLLYSVRKRVKVLRGLGPLSRWLDLHIFLGITGPALVVLHSTFKVQGLVALSFWSMIAVALSGVAGRFLYLQIPRTRAGEEITLTQLREQDQVLSERLRNEFGLPTESLARLDSIAGPKEAQPRFARLLLEMLFGARRDRRELARFVRQCRGVPPALVRRFEQVAREKAASRRRILMWNRVHELFHYWHVVHKPFAAVMYLFMVVHIVVAVMMGYGWR